MAKESSWALSGNLFSGNTNVGVLLTQKFNELGNYTVQFGLGPLPKPYTTRPMAVADIDWMVAGQRIHRRVTVIDGTALTGTADAISVRLVDSGVLSPITPLQYVGSVSIAKGTRGTDKQPPFFWLGSTQVNPGTNVSVIVPDDIGALSLMARVGPLDPALPGALSATMPVPYGSVTIQQISVVALNTYEPRDYDWNPLSPGCQAIKCFADIGLPGPVAFDLYLGIEG